jgi:hypothetical protein
MARHHGVDLEEHVERKWLVWHPDRSASAVGGSEPTAKTVGLLSGLRNIGTVDGAKQ